MTQRALGESDCALLAARVCDSYDKELVRSSLGSLIQDLGGMEQFVRPGQTVLLKPNLLGPFPPERAVTTHPIVVAVMIEMCLEAGVSRVWVSDSPAGRHSDEELWDITGMKAVVEGAGGKLKSASSHVLSFAFKDARLPIPKWYEEVDCLISLPKLKTHLLTAMTCSLKNVYGLIVGETKALYHRNYPSPFRMSEFLVDIYEVFRPCLSIVDAIEVMEGDGPAGGGVVHVGALVGGSDAVALDSVCAGVFGLSPCEIPMIRVASERGIGVSDLERIQVVGDGSGRLKKTSRQLPKGLFLQKIPDSLYRMATRALRFRPRVSHDECVQCGICGEICAQDAISSNRQGRIVIDNKKCILCMCCMESCPQHAIYVRSVMALAGKIRSALSLKYWVGFMHREQGNGGVD